MRLLALLMCIVPLFACIPDATPDQISSQARTFSRQMGYDAVSVSCVSRDSDLDGYISCTSANPTPGAPPLAFECSTAIDGGCRLTVDR